MYFYILFLILISAGTQSCEGVEMQEIPGVLLAEPEGAEKCVWWSNQGGPAGRFGGQKAKKMYNFLIYWINPTLRRIQFNADDTNYKHNKPDKGSLWT